MGGFPRDTLKAASRKGMNLPLCGQHVQDSRGSPKWGLMVEADGPAVSSHNGFIGEAAPPCAHSFLLLLCCDCF